jgi:hypothetical protein
MALAWAVIESGWHCAGVNVPSSNRIFELDPIGPKQSVGPSLRLTVWMSETPPVPRPASNKEGNELNKKIQQEENT